MGEGCGREKGEGWERREVIRMVGSWGGGRSYILGGFLHLHLVLTLRVLVIETASRGGGEDRCLRSVAVMLMASLHYGLYIT